MAFTKTIEVEPYLSGPPPIFDDGRAIYLERELQEISRVINRLADSITEIQEYLATLP